jgi:hypothetical protein
MPISYPHASGSGQFLSDIFLILYIELMRPIYSLGIAGPSNVHHVQQNRKGAIPKPYPAKGEWYIAVPEKPK